MGFSGGGSNVLKNHQHDATVVQDGGSLDADNVTSADLTQGDVIFSDGVHLQRLAIGTPAQQLQTNAGATAPEWTTAAAGTNNRVILDSQTFTASTTSTITFTPGTPIDDSVYQKIQIVFTGNGLGNSIDRAMFRLDSGLTNTNYNENSIELFNGVLQLMNRNPQSAGDDYVRLTDQLANGGEGWIITIDLQIPPSGQTATSLLYQVSNHDRVAIGSGWVTGIAASVITRIQIDLQNATNNKDMQFTVYGIKF